MSNKKNKKTDKKRAHKTSLNLFLSQAKKEDPRSLIIKKANRTTLWDYHNKNFTDYELSNGKLILGHSHKNVVLSIKKTAEQGVCLNSTTKNEFDLRYIIKNAFKSIESLVFLNTEQNALRTAINLSYSHTQKKDILIFSNDRYCTANEKNIHVSKFNDISDLKKNIASLNDKLACVILDPISIENSITIASNDFFKEIRELTHTNNIILIFNEILAGFRGTRGGFQTETNIYPDLTVLGNIIGGGFPLGAIGGNKKIIDNLGTKKTSHNNSVIMSAGLATLKLLNNEFYKALNNTCEKFTEGLDSFFTNKVLDVTISHYKSIFKIVFPQDRRTDKEYHELHKYLLKNGLYLPQEAKNPFFISKMHTQKELKKLSQTIQLFFSKNQSEKSNFLSS